MRWHVINAVFKRNVASYFSGVLGYLFIIVFVLVAALLAFDDEFFSNNLANLDQLNERFPLLLLFIVPAITMSCWSDEKKMGTDELLFTLPARDVEILLAKYLSVLAIYTVALLFSTTQLAVLGWYANPDWGMLFTTYFGYWVSGAALLSVGMFASSLTSSTTVAFVLGAVFCSVPVFIQHLSSGNEFLRSLSLAEQFSEFGRGTIPMVGLLYFVSLTVFMLYLNLVVISKRHWSASQQANMGMQFGVRVLSLAAILISLNFVARSYGGVLSLQVDMTDEQIYSLTDTTLEILDSVDEESPITIQAFLSPRNHVPREFVSVYKTLVGMLRQYDRQGGSLIRVRFVDVLPFSEEAEQAALYGIQSRTVQSEVGGRMQVENLFLGVVVTSPNDEVVIPFFESKMPVEYELTRSIRTVSQQDRLSVGILQTDAQVTGGFDSGSFRSLPEWQIVAELKKQYDVQTVAADSPIESGKFDVLVAVMPSSLTEPQLGHLVEYVKAGNPTLIFDDPLPVTVGVQLAPRLPKPRPGGMFSQGPPPEQKADGGRLTSLLNVLEVAWDYDRVVFDEFNPHPNLEQLVRPELVWISAASGEPAFDADNPISSGLQEVLAFFPGHVRKRDSSDHEVEYLMATTSRTSGVLDWEQFTQPGMFGGVQLRDDYVGIIKPEVPYALAAHIKSSDGLNVVFVTDVDCITDAMFDIVRNERFDLKLDNVTFVLNAVDVLAGDESYLPLRKRRPEHRTLVKIQEETDVFRRQAQEQIEAAEEEAEAELAKRRASFEERQAAIRENETLSAREKQIQLQMAAQDEQRRLDVMEENIERKKQAEIAELKRQEQRKILNKEEEIKTQAVVMPAVPAILLGVIVLCFKVAAERHDVDPRRAVR